MSNSIDVKEKPEWGMHGQTAERLGQACIKLDEVSEEVLSGKDDLIPRWYARLNVVRIILMPFLHDKDAERYNTEFFNMMNYLRASKEGRKKYSQAEPFKTYMKKYPGLKLEEWSSLIPFLYKYYHEVTLVMNQAGLLFYKGSVASKEVMLRKIKGYD